jgi:hypothetical protein
MIFERSDNITLNVIFVKFKGRAGHVTHFSLTMEAPFKFRRKSLSADPPSCPPSPDPAFDSDAFSTDDLDAFYPNSFFLVSAERGRWRSDPIHVFQPRKEFMSTPSTPLAVSVLLRFQVDLSTCLTPCSLGYNRDRDILFSAINAILRP